MEGLQQYQISLNFEGNDITVSVNDLETAALLLNDTDAAYNFLKANYPQIISASYDVYNSETDLEEIDQTSTTENIVIESQIWTKKKPTERDNEATALLLSLREKMDTLFSDKKTNKSKLWNKIALILSEKKFKIGENGAERCRQKFANLVKSYLNYIKNQKTTGSQRIDEPPFFQELHSILGSKHKVKPLVLEDSMETELQNKAEKTRSEGEGEPSISNEPSKTKDFQNRFSQASANKRVRPLTKAEEILNELKKDQQVRSNEFDCLKKHLDKTEQQRDRFLNIMERAFLKGKKRKRETSRSSSSDSN